MSLEERLKDLGEIIRIDATKKERERIIELLDAECCELIDCRCEMRIKWAIALIKGENK